MPNKRKDLNISGVDLWYLVGLITSDGCLCKDERHVDITAKELNFLQAIKRQLGLTNKVCIKNRNTNKQAYRIQIANKNFYEFLLSIGLTPNKSLTLEKVNVPSKFFTDFLRGLIDGDGCIRGWVHPSNRREQWSLRIYSGSTVFLEWLSQSIEETLQARGRISRKNKQGSCYALKFGKLAARRIVQQCYYPESFCLERKRSLAEECVNSYLGWGRSKTVDRWELN